MLERGGKGATSTLSRCPPLQACPAQHAAITAEVASWLPMLLEHTTSRESLGKPCNGS